MTLSKLFKLFSIITVAVSAATRTTTEPVFHISTAYNGEVDTHCVNDPFLNEHHCQISIADPETPQKTSAVGYFTFFKSNNVNRCVSTDSSKVVLHQGTKDKNHICVVPVGAIAPEDMEPCDDTLNVKDTCAVTLHTPFKNHF